MKKLIFLAIMVLFTSNLFSQNFQSVQYKTLKWYNTSGTQVFKGSHTSSPATAIDTIVSEFIPFDADEFKFSLSCGFGDTMYANVGYSLVAGVNPNSVPTNAGLYSRGGIAIVNADSIISLGLRQAIVGQTARFSLTGAFAPIGHTSTQGGYAGSRDSTWTNTFGSTGALTAASLGYSGFRVVIRFYPSPQDVSNTTLLNQHVLIIRRGF